MDRSSEIPCEAFIQDAFLSDVEADSTTKANNSAERIIVSATVELPVDQSVDKYRRHGFRIGDTRLLVPEGMACEVGNDITDAVAVSRMPNSPRWLIGLVNLRGNIVPVLDLTVLLNIYATDKISRKYLFFQIENDWVGVIANGLPQLVSLPPKYKLESLPAMPWELRPYVNSCYRNEGTWFDCDLKAIFNWVESYVKI